MKLFKSSNQIVAEIHNEFDTAQERLLQEAKQIIAAADEATIDKAERLEKIGFINSETVKKVKNINIVKNKEEAQMIEYYKQNYPFQKFLTESELHRICKKYNLIYAPVTNYIKDVPEKNLEEIENSINLKRGDLPYSDNLIKYDRGNISKNCPLEIKKLLNAGISGEDWTDAKRNFYLKTGEELDQYVYYITMQYSLITINKIGLFIAAPKSHFNLKGLKKQGLFGFLNISITEVKDPIVFRYCRGGIQVLSKWGLEGKDEALVNEKMN